MAAANVLPPMATGAPTPRPYLTWKTTSGARPIIKGNANANFESEKVTFDPKRHLSYTPPTKVHTMAELGYPDDLGVSPVGVSEPFPLFNSEAIQQMRRETLRPEVWDKYQFSTDTRCRLRGYAPE